MKPVLCFGDICADLLLPYGMAVSDRREEADLSVRFSHGGSVANTAASLSRLDVPVMFLGTAGEDAFGYALKGELEKEGVDVSCLALKSGCMTTMVFLVIDEQGERIPFAYPATGASQHNITADQIPDDLLSRIGWMHSSGMTLREEPAAKEQLRLMKQCRQAGIPVSLDINARLESIHSQEFHQNMQEALLYCNLLFGSQEEICSLTESMGLIETDALLHTVDTVVIRKGNEGAEVHTKQGRWFSPALSVPVVDKVGAGDVYNGAYIFALLNGCSPERANKLACAAGAWCVSHKGGRSGPTKEQVGSLLNG